MNLYAYFMQVIKKLFIILINKTSILAGGQAVIEGVLMRVPGSYATAVRNPKGEVIFQKFKFQSLTEKYKLLKLPIVRGVIHLYESLKIGYGSLQWSAEIYDAEEAQVNPIIEWIMTFLSIGFAVSLFLIIPISASEFFLEKNSNPFYFNVISGIFRIMIFLIYLLLISLMNDVKRLFQYHGAEHKTIYNFESGKKLSIENAKPFTTLHPRCGTSFVFILLMIGIVSFGVLDTIILNLGIVKEFNIINRVLFHLPLVPVVAGIGYEFLKLTAKYRNNIIFKTFAAPGLWLQLITTKEPDDDQLEIAILALEEAFGDKINNFKNSEFVADAIG